MGAAIFNAVIMTTGVIITQGATNYLTLWCEFYQQNNHS